MKVGDLVKHKAFDDLYGVVTSVDPRDSFSRIEVLWSYDAFKLTRHTPHHPDRLEVVSESR